MLHSRNAWTATTRLAAAGPCSFGLPWPGLMESLRIELCSQLIQLLQGLCPACNPVPCCPYRYKGVSKKKGRWEAKVMVNRKWAYRELFDSEEAAARAYDTAGGPMTLSAACVWSPWESVSPAGLSALLLARLVLSCGCAMC